MNYMYNYTHIYDMWKYAILLYYETVKIYFYMYIALI